VDLRSVAAVSCSSRVNSMADCDDHSEWMADLTGRVILSLSENRDACCLGGLTDVGFIKGIIAFVVLALIAFVCNTDIRVWSHKSRGVAVASNVSCRFCQGPFCGDQFVAVRLRRLVSGG